MGPPENLFLMLCFTTDSFEKNCFSLQAYIESLRSDLNDLLRSIIHNRGRIQSGEYRSNPFYSLKHLVTWIHQRRHTYYIIKSFFFQILEFNKQKVRKKEVLDFIRKFFFRECATLL